MNGPPKMSPMKKTLSRSLEPLGWMSASISVPPTRTPVQSPDGTKIRRPITRNATPAPTLGFGGGGGLYRGSDKRCLPQFHVQAVAIEKIVGVEGDDLRARRHEMDAGAFHRGDTEIVAVEKRDDGDAEDLVVAEIVGHLDLRQAAEQVAQHRLGALAR